ncbi:MAG: HAD-IB family phosphatase [Deltaproteobacteria bacterium]|nr:HAD-IB family phosphatase [Deltaproteobacteria bacterium]
MSQSRYRLVCFDVDGTLVGRTVFVWQTLHEHFATDAAERQKAWDDYFSGRVSYAQWFEHDIRLLRERGADRRRMLHAISALELVAGAHETLQALKDAGLVLAVISGSLNLVIEHFALGRYFDHVFVNELYFDREDRLIGWRPTPFDLESKAAGLEWLMGKHGLCAAETAFVGDNFNDLSIARRAGLGIAFGSKCEELVRACAVCVPGDDLRAILPHVLEG